MPPRRNIRVRRDRRWVCSACHDPPDPVRSAIADSVVIAYTEVHVMPSALDGHGLLLGAAAVVNRSWILDARPDFDAGLVKAGEP